MQEYFFGLADHLTAELENGEVFTSMFRAEDSDFVRFNQGKVRQAGSVVQRALRIDLIRGSRHANAAVGLCGDAQLDRERLGRVLARLRDQIGSLPEDPYLLYATDGTSTERIAPNELPEAQDAVEAIQQSARDRDLVGIYAGGGIHAGFANSLGQRNWYTTYSFNFDWSFYRNADKAVKSAYAGFQWNPQTFDRKVGFAAHQLEALARKPHTAKPGTYRVYLSPAAVHDFVGMLGWGGFGLKALKTKNTPLLRLVEGDARLSDAVEIRENTAEGVAPNFQEEGFVRPGSVSLISRGAHAGSLVSPRSAREYGEPTNGASAGETPESVDVAAGSIPQNEVLERLGTGVYVGNVWYLNFSDRSNCRTTGMTRFATFWVENGEIQAPLNVMRFDETIYRMLGENLEGLTQERDWILDPDTYFQRSTASGRMPGALIDDFPFTL